MLLAFAVHVRKSCGFSELSLPLAAERSHIAAMVRVKTKRRFRYLPSGLRLFHGVEGAEMLVNTISPNRGSPALAVPIAANT
jgi:hypothetical protein